MKPLRAARGVCSPQSLVRMCPPPAEPRKQPQPPGPLRAPRRAGHRAGAAAPCPGRAVPGGFPRPPAPGFARLRRGARRRCPPGGSAGGRWRTDVAAFGCPGAAGSRPPRSAGRSPLLPLAPGGAPAACPARLRCAACGSGARHMPLCGCCDGSHGATEPSLDTNLSKGRPLPAARCPPGCRPITSGQPARGAVRALGRGPEVGHRARAAWLPGSAFRRAGGPRAAAGQPGPGDPRRRKLPGRPRSAAPAASPRPAPGCIPRVLPGGSRGSGTPWKQPGAHPTDTAVGPLGAGAQPAGPPAPASGVGVRREALLALRCGALRLNQFFLRCSKASMSWGNTPRSCSWLAA